MVTIMNKDVISSIVLDEVHERSVNATSTTNANTTRLHPTKTTAAPGVTNDDNVVTSMTIIDVISIGSNTRLDYLWAQETTWGSHNSIRHFIPVTEDDDPVSSTTSRSSRSPVPAADDGEKDNSNKNNNNKCHTLLSPEDVYSISDWCHNEYTVQKKKQTAASTKEEEDAAYEHGRDIPQLLSSSYRKRYFATRKYLSKKSNPVGWLCAQRRFVYGLMKYKNKLEDSNDDAVLLPDYLLLVDDDTYYNIDLLLDELRSQQQQQRSTAVRASAPPNVYVGCLMIANKKRTIQFGYGGFGTILNKASLKRLMIDKLQCNDDDDEGDNGRQTNVGRPVLEVEEDRQEDDDQHHQGSTNHNVCTILSKNLLGEKCYYVNNHNKAMSLLDVLDAWAINHAPFTLYKNWTSSTATAAKTTMTAKVGSGGFCYHSDHLLATIVELYQLSSPSTTLSPYYLHPIHNSIVAFHSGDGVDGDDSAIAGHNNCLNDYDNCNNGTTSIVCHYQTPLQMRQFYNLPNLR